MPEQPRFSDEIKSMEYEPMLPVEVSLVRWSIGLGLVLIGILMWVSRTFF